MKSIVAVMMFAGLSSAALAGGEDDPLLYKVMVDKLELRNANGPDALVLEADAWVGYDLNKLWIKTDVERVNGNTEEAELQFLYSRAVAPFWDFQVGWRHDIKPKPTRDYLALGFKGLAPYQFEVDAGLFIGESGQVNARVDAEYEYMFTQKLILSPEVAVNLYSQDDAEVGIGSCLSDMELGLRLGYEIRREIAPYIGVNWTRYFGRTADHAKTGGNDASVVQLVAGNRIWL
jgi:copper resistance protein B